jgi:hypothetical protein
MAQNFFQTEPETSRYDAGLGLVLRGDGRGGFKAVSAKESGIRVLGEQRGCAIGDFDRDGRVDWCVTQNNGATQLYRNQFAKPGLRVKLAGTNGNPDGVGALVRLELGAGNGSAQEVTAGSGYASQNSSVLVMATPTVPKAVLVQWPGGAQTKHLVPDGAKEVVCTVDGKTTVN